MGDKEDLGAPATKADINKLMDMLTKMDGKLSKNTEAIGKIHNRLDALDSSHVKLCDRVIRSALTLIDVTVCPQGKTVIHPIPVLLCCILLQVHRRQNF